MPQLDTILIPKVGVPADVYTVECIVSQIEVAKGLTNKIGTEALIETPLGMANVEAIAAAPSRLESMHFGVADYSAFNKARTVVIGGLNPDYPGDQWHFPLSRMTVACRAYGFARSMDPSAASTIRKAIRQQRVVARRSEWKANGPSILRRSNSPTRSIRRPPRKSSAPNAFSSRSRKPKLKARAPLLSTAR